MYLIPALIAIGLVVFAGIFLATFALARSYWAVERIRPEAAGTAQYPGWHSHVARLEGLLKSVGETIPRPPEELSRQGLKLVQAGIRRKDGPILFIGIQAGLAVVLLVALVPTGLVQPLLGLILAVFAGAALPDIALRAKISRRKQRIQDALPDALDLTVICVEAGLGLNQAILRIGQELAVSYPELSDEFNLFNLELKAGRTRVEAMRNLARRTDLADLKSLVAILIQSDRFGTSIGQSLRVFADGMRVKRRQRAEERAAKLAIKMIPPMIVFVFPSIFVVVAGPAVISIVRGLLPFLAGPGS
jgi:tight adherence protein C